GMLMCAGLGYAQGVNPAPPSSSFNYLNLARGGNPALNYFGIVRPNAMNQNAWLAAQQQISSLNSNRGNNEQDGTIRQTGVGATFMNLGHYYPRAAGLTGGRPGAGTGMQAPRR
ncbi:MAG TPA: hypothetical protein PKA06_12100, partial [Gemmatales bacterium]|nr:hypothetical protein [Gemmatales bacterium]